VTAVQEQIVERPAGSVERSARIVEKTLNIRAAKFSLWRTINQLGTENLLFVWLFIIYGFVAIPIFALLTPSYQVSDEIAHFLRADQVALGQWIGIRASPTQSGGIVDQSISDSFNLFSPIILHPERKVTASILNHASEIYWGNVKSFREFNNTAIYPPFYYVVTAWAIRLGKWTNMSVVRTLKVARLMNGAAAILLGAVALVLAGSAAPWFFALLTLPMTLSEMASASQDALLIPMAAVAAALFIRLLREGFYDRIGFGVFCALLGLIAMGRITYITLALLPLALSRYSLTARLLGCAVVTASGLAWAWIASRLVLVPFGLAGANAPEQIRRLLAHPSLIFPLIRNTMRYQWDLYIESFVGKLGWLDLKLPWSYIVLAVCDLAVAALACVTTAAGRRRTIFYRIIVLIALITSIAALFAVLYVSWTPVGNFIVDGIQGRYFIPLAFFLAALIAVGAQPVLRPVATVCKLLVAVFPFITTPVVLLGIVSRYYLS
jgi:uncharacterized membrane protein